MGKSDKKRKSTDAPAEPVAEVVAASTSETVEKISKDIPGSAKKKSKKSKDSNVKADGPSKDIVMADGDAPEPVDTIDALSPIAHPLADKKLGKRVLRTVKKGMPNHLLDRFQSYCERDRANFLVRIKTSIHQARCERGSEGSTEGWKGVS